MQKLSDQGDKAITVFDVKKLKFFYFSKVMLLSTKEIAGNGT